jgi:uncharacterized membrane protein YdbT with pleckstrin-like domain
MEQDHLLEEGETMLEKVRKHWVVYIDDFILHLLGCIVFLIAAIFISNTQFFAALHSGDKAHISMVLVGFVLLFWTSFFYFWTKNYFDVWYLTDRHIIAVNQKDMFDRDESFMELERIQDVMFEKVGFVQTFFGYGKLKVQSAGTEVEFIIDNVHDVEDVVHRIMELRDKAQGKKTDTGLAESKVKAKSVSK